MTYRIELRTGCRLHFGLMELCDGQPLHYAGLGLMLQQPNLVLRVEQGDRAEVQLSKDLESMLGNAQLVEHRQRLDRWLAESKGMHEQRLRVWVQELFPLHCGLGTGTQLACLLAAVESTAGSLFGDKAEPDGWWAGIHDPTDASQESILEQPTYRSVGQLSPNLTAQRLAELSGRGLRSAIGLKGFLSGGLILDAGRSLHGISKNPPFSLASPADLAPARTDSASRPIHAVSFAFPEPWRVVLVRAHPSSAITGSVEASIIRSMADRPNPSRELMWSDAQSAMQAAVEQNFSAFCHYLDRYMLNASSLFTLAQGGRFNGAVCSLAAECAQSAGLHAVGQSSWGPTIFGFAASEQAAQSATEQLRSLPHGWNISICRANNTGALLRQI